MLRNQTRNIGFYKELWFVLAAMFFMVTQDKNLCLDQYLIISSPALFAIGPY